MGEALAAAYLERRGWHVLARNERVGRRELDIIAVRSGIVAFVEVKSRAGRAFGGPLDAITPDKQRDVARAASEWLRCRKFPSGTLIRFDAVGVTWAPDGSCEIHHVEDAWYRD